MQVLIGPDEGAPNFIMRRFTIMPGGSIPAHLHPSIEHEQYVLSGSMKLGLGDSQRVVTAGEAVFIPAGVAHWYENEGEQPVVFLCVIPKTKNFETEWL